VPPVENRTGNEDGGESTGEDTVDEDFAVETDIACTEDEERHGTEEDGRRREDRTGQRPVNRHVDDVAQRTAGVTVQFLADTVEDDDGIVD